MHIIRDINESLRIAKHFAEGAKRAGEIGDNRIGFVKLNLRVIQYAEQALAQLHLANEMLGACGLRGTLDVEAQRVEALRLTVDAQQAIVDCL